MIFGATLSHRELVHLGVDLAFALQCVKELESLRMLRICGYWDQLQPSPSQYDFSSVEPFLHFCEREKKACVFTLGMKAPRWPEFFLPSWLTSANESDIQPHLFTFMKQTIKHFHQQKCIKYWQVENEPLDPSGPHKKKISVALLQQEIELVRSLDPTRQIITTLWGNTLTQRGLLPSLASISDIVGVDLYWKVPFAKFFYSGPADSIDQLRSTLTKTEQPYWITELQAEPWEHSPFDYLLKEPRSFNIAQFKKNIEAGLALQPEVILLWGLEYWIWRRVHGDEQFWEEVKRILLHLSN